MIKLTDKQRKELITDLEIILRAMQGDSSTIPYQNADQHLEANIEYVRYCEELPANKGYWFQMISDRTSCFLPEWFPKYAKTKTSGKEEFFLAPQQEMNVEVAMVKSESIELTNLKPTTSTLGKKLDSPNQRVAERTSVQDEADELQQQINKMQAELNHKNRLIERASKADISVTDHAVIRYLERVEGFDLENIRSQIRDIVQQEVDKHGDCVVKNQGWQFIVRDDVVTTIVDKHSIVTDERQSKHLHLANQPNAA